MNSQPNSFIRLSSDQFAERDRIESTREVYGRAILKIDFEPLPEVPFHFDMIMRALPEFGQAFGTTSATNYTRTSSLTDSDDLILTVAFSGGGVFHVHGRETKVGGGSAALTSCADVGTFHVPSTSHLANFRFTFNRIAPLIADLDAALVRPISENNEALRLMVNYARALRDEQTLATPELRSLVVTHMHDLAALVVGATRDAAAIASARGIRAARLAAIKSDILSNLHRFDLSVTLVAARNGVTPRYVYKLLETEGVTFSEYVITQRLMRAHHMLSDLRFADQPINSIAFAVGFGDLSYFNRTFRRRYGMTPSDVREQVRGKG